MLWVMSGNFFPKHQNSHAYVARLGTPPLPPPLSRWPKHFKNQIKVDAYTHPRMLKSDTHLGLILSSNFLIGSLAESLLSESNVHTVWTSSNFSANKKQGKKHLLQLELELFIQGWFGKPHSRHKFSKQMWESQASFFILNGLQTVQLSGWQNSTENTACFMRKSLWSKMRTPPHYSLENLWPGWDPPKAV